MEDGHWHVDQCLAMLMTLTLDYNEIQVISYKILLIKNKCVLVFILLINYYN
ncbi:hypothetical protein SDC9_50955 [bioreactor metagenome]|uniref:Uncharacterized protein n=1 Tax=bioreactor metagenome TaxID=1076179 RepID=A0A644WLC2_9ZZZZ